MEKETFYSPLIRSLQQTFEAHAEAGHRYLLLYWQGWGETTACVPVNKGQYPWTRHDDYMEGDKNASILAIAFDLQKDFASQVPAHMRGFETLEGFAYKPLVWIPDREGKVPAEREQAAVKEMLRPKPQLRLVT